MTRPTLLAAVLILGAAVSILPLSSALEARAPHGEGRFGTSPILPRAAVLRPLLLGFHPLAADLYWLRTIQYFGGHLETDRQFTSLYELVDLVTSLDPHFVVGYELGGLFLSIVKRNPEAIAIYEKGIKANPERWELPYDLGRLYFLEFKDYPAALHWWQAADRLPGRPDYLPRMIARLYSKTGALETAFELWKELYEMSNNDWVRKTALREMRKILAEMRAQGPAGYGR